MARKIRATLDTNVLVSAKIKREGVASKILEAWLLGKFELICSFQILDETVSVLKALKYPPRLIDGFVGLLTMYGHIQDTSTIEKVSSKHKEDNKITACALAGGATHLVTFNSKHFDLKAYPTIKLITPSRFLKIVEQFKGG